MSATLPSELRPVTVVIVHWNQPAACLATLDEFRGQGVPVRFLVVDNRSEPAALDTLRVAAAAATDVELIECATNTGFSGGANAGLHRWLDDPDPDASPDDWALLCPHDVALAPGCISALLTAAAAEPMAGLACADVGDGHVPSIDPYFGGMTVVDPELDPARHPDRRPATADDPVWREADFPHGTLMALRRACIAEVGLFDERFFAYCEEADLALRARRAGWRCGVVRGADVRNVHLGSSVPLVAYLQERNTLRLVRSMSGRYHATIRLLLGLAQVVSGVLRPERAPLTFDARARLLGMRDFLLGRTGAPPASVIGRRPAR